jgi:hypothetical protein
VPLILRANLIDDWIKFLKERQTPMTEGLVDPLKVSSPPALNIELLLFSHTDLALCDPESLCFAFIVIASSCLCNCGSSGQ